MKTRKKWLRKTTAICTAALLGTAAIPSTAFAADSYASIEKDAWAKKVTEMASSYATSIEESQSLMSGMQSDMILKFEDSGRSLLNNFQCILNMTFYTERQCFKSLQEDE